ncbi:MAG: carboxypeptidase regulatory-like domain-containing protein [Bacteroidales bacterium]|nr:carboxypeptidase regulatory-like domain-containing protein [Bacteroidales bacterium]
MCLRNECVHGIVQLPITASLAYIGGDGFILNTEYILPDPSKNLALGEPWGGGEAIEPIPKTALSVEAPGQYKVRMPLDDFDGSDLFYVGHQGYRLSFVYDFGYWDDVLQIYVPMYIYREAQLMSERYKKPLRLNATFQGQAFPAEIDLLRRNIDGVLEATTIATADDTTEVFVFADSCYLKVRPADRTAETYYPGTLLWSEALPVVPGFDTASWTPLFFSVAALPLLSPTVGIGVIEGKVDLSAEVSTKPFGPYRTARSAGPYTLYLKETGGQIIAQAVTDAGGYYRFEQLPFGNYQILLNCEGYTQASVHEVRLTAEQPTVSGKNYVLFEGRAVATAIDIVTAGRTGETWFDLQGRPQLETRRPGIYLDSREKVLIK